MLVVTANWSIADGTVYGPPPRSAVQTFLRELRRSACRSGFRADGLYRPADGIHLVFAGDTFDGLTTLAWEGDLRPWHGGARCRATAERIAAAAARQGARLLATLGRLRRRGLPIPAADRHGRPTPGLTKPTPVSITCLIGDRDRALDGRWFAAAASRHGIAIGTEQTSDAVVIRHGAECDPLCGLPDMPADGRPPTLGESLAVDLLGEFARRLHAAGLTHRTAAPVVRHLATAPPLEMPGLIHGLLAAADGRPAGWPAEIIRDAWLHAVQHWHESARVTAPEAAVEHDVVDAVAGWMAAGVAPDSLPAMAVVETLRPRVAAPAAGPVLVLGHPPPHAVAAQVASTGHCICLGPGRQREYARAVGRDCPAAFAFPDIAAPRGTWLASTAGAQRDIDWRPHVTPMGARADVPGIVDAA